MVHSAAVYFTLEDGVYLLCPERYGTVPIGISIPDFAGVVGALHSKQGQKITLADHVLTFSGSQLLLQLSGYEEEAVRCIPDPVRCRQAAAVLAARGKKTGLAGLSGPLFQGYPLDKTSGPLCAHAQPAVTALLRGILEKEQTQIAAGAADLLGLGVGLTPSGDDLLTGLIYGLQRSDCADSPQLKWLTNAVQAQAPQRTNRVSNAYLQAICAGMPFERMERAWLGLDSRFPPAETDLLAIGSNSGGEMLLGLLLAAHCIRNGAAF